MSLDSKALAQLEEVSKHLFHAYSVIHPEKKLDFKDSNNASIEERLARLEWIADIFEGKQSTLPTTTTTTTTTTTAPTPTPTHTVTPTPAPVTPPVTTPTPTPTTTTTTTTVPTPAKTTTTPPVEAKKETPKVAQTATPAKPSTPAPTPAPTTTKAVTSATQAPAPAAKPSSSSTPTITQFYSFERLKKEKIDGVDPLLKELWLSEEEFKVVFGMTKAEWHVAPAWKKQQKKKEKNMF